MSDGKYASLDTRCILFPSFSFLQQRYNNWKQYIFFITKYLVNHWTFGEPPERKWHIFYLLDSTNDTGPAGIKLNDQANSQIDLHTQEN